MNSKFLIALVLAILLVLNILSYFLFLRFDWTENDRYSISDSTIGILNELEDIVTVKAYFSTELPAQFLGVQQYVSDILSEYKAYGGGNFDYEFVDPGANSASSELKQEARRIGVNEVSMQIRENDSYQVKNGYMGIGIFYEGKTESLPVIQQENLGTLEYDLTSLIIKMSQPRLQVVGFLQGHGEKLMSGGVSPNGQASAQGYSAVSQVLQKNYQIKEINFSQNHTLEGVDVLVVAGAQRDLTDRDIFEIDQYLLQGGKAIFLIDTIKNVEGTITVEPMDINLGTLFAPWGITVQQNMMLDTLSLMTNFSQQDGRMFFSQYPPFIKLSAQNFSSNPIVAKLSGFAVRFISGILIGDPVEGLTYDAFASTSPASWQQVAPFSIDPQNIPSPQAGEGGAQPVGVYISGMLPRISTATDVPTLQQWQPVGEAGGFELKPASGDTHRSGREIIGQATDEGRVVIFSDSDFIADAYLAQDQTALVVFLNMVDFLTFGEELINIRAKALSGAPIKTLSDSRRLLMKFLGIAGVPILLSVFGVFRLWMRRKEEKLLKL